MKHNTRRSAAVVGIAVAGSRIFGLVRELTFAAMFGAGTLLDAFLGAFQIPNLLRDLFAEGALSTAFTTVFTKTWEREGDVPAWHLANLIISALLLVVGVICLLGIIASPLIVAITNYGFHHIQGKFELTVQLTRVLFPFILFVSLAAVVMGMLNARFIFGLPASASTVFNIVSVITGVLLAYALDPQQDWRHPYFTERGLFGIALGVLIGGLAQLGMQLPSLWRLGFRYRWKLDWSHPRFREVLVLMLPSVIAGSAVQVNVLVNGLFASQIDGARSWLYCAFRLMQFPIGVVGVAIATVTLPAVSRHHAQENLKAFGQTVQESLRLAFYLTIPASVGLAVLAEPIIRLIYQHGRFDAAQTHQTAIALQAYVIGLAGYAGIKVLAPCFYALNEPNIPLRVSLLGIGLNLVLNVVLVLGCKLGHVGLATTTGFVALLNFLQLLIYMRRQVDCGSAKEWYPFLAKILTAALACGFTAWLLHHQLWHRIGHSWLAEALATFIAITSAGGVYVGVTAMFNVSESSAVLRVFQRLMRHNTQNSKPETRN